ncbi:hypothetical protein BDN71DRAFT_1593834, partial [Pleurotus eryngii]
MRARFSPPFSAGAVCDTQDATSGLSPSLSHTHSYFVGPASTSTSTSSDVKSPLRLSPQFDAQVEYHRRLSCRAPPGTPESVELSWIGSAAGQLTGMPVDVHNSRTTRGSFCRASSWISAATTSSPQRSIAPLLRYRPQSPWISSATASTSWRSIAPLPTTIWNCDCGDYLSFVPPRSFPRMSSAITLTSSVIEHKLALLPC